MNPNRPSFLNSDLAGAWREYVSGFQVVPEMLDPRSLPTWLLGQTKIRLMPLHCLPLSPFTILACLLLANRKHPVNTSSFLVFFLALRERIMMVCLHIHTFSRGRRPEEHVPSVSWEFVFYFKD